MCRAQTPSLARQWLPHQPALLCKKKRRDEHAASVDRYRACDIAAPRGHANQNGRQEDPSHRCQCHQLDRQWHVDVRK